jgi:hypothetical protein
VSWRGPTPSSRTDGIDVPIHRLKKTHSQNWALIFTDEASFRQDSTLHATWSQMGQPPEVPVTGERKNVKILGAIALWRTRFHYREDTVFNASSYLAVLGAVGTIIPSAGSHSHPGQRLLSQGWGNLELVPLQPPWLEVHQLPGGSFSAVPILRKL